MKEELSYKILLDKDWSLEEFTVFTRLYFQNYSFIYCLETIGNSDILQQEFKLKKCFEKL